MVFKGFCVKVIMLLHLLVEKNEVLQNIIILAPGYKAML